MNMHVIYNNKIDATTKLYVNTQKKLCLYINRNQITRSNDNKFDFSRHVINDLEFNWITAHSETPSSFLKDLLTQVAKGPWGYDPCCLVPIDELIRVKQVYTDEMANLHIKRLARSLLIKQKFIGCHNGVPLVSFDNNVYSSMERRENGK